LNLYNQYSDAKISYDKYLIEQKASDEKSNDLAIQIDILKENIVIAEKENLEPAMEIIKKFSYPTEYSDELVSALIDYIIVYDENHIEIEWKFKDFLMQKL